jgi:hypothetical protein
MALVWGSVASAQTVGEGQHTQLTGTKVSVVTGNAQDTLGVSLRQGTVTGSLLTDDAGRDRSVVLTDGSDIISGTYVPGNCGISAPISTQGLTGLAIELLVSASNLSDSAGVYYFGVRVMRAYSASADSAIALTERRAPSPTALDSCGTLSGLGAVAISTLPASSVTGLPTTGMPNEIIVPVIVGDVRSRNSFINLTARIPSGSPDVVLAVRPISATMGAALTTSVTTVATTFRVNVRGWR